MKNNRSETIINSRFLLASLAIFVVFTMLFQSIYAADMAQVFKLKDHTAGVPLLLDPRTKASIATIRKNEYFIKLGESGDFWLICLADGLAGWIYKNTAWKEFVPSPASSYVYELFEMEKLYPLNYNILGKYQNENSSKLSGATGYSQNRYSNRKDYYKNRLSIQEKKPEIIISLTGLTMRVHMPEFGHDIVYPVGVGLKDVDGVSITPLSPENGWQSSSDTNSAFYYREHRFQPAWCGGLPYIIVEKSGDGWLSLHGPGYGHDGFGTLRRGWVTHGGISLRQQDIVELYKLMQKWPGMTVNVIHDRDVWPDGSIVDVNYPIWPHDIRTGIIRNADSRLRNIEREDDRPRLQMLRTRIRID